MHKIPNDVELFLSLQNVSLRFYDRIVFPNTSWHFYNNQHWAIIGANGSGKSILARALCGQAPAVKGKLIYHFMEQGVSDHCSQTHTQPQDHVAYVCSDMQKTALRRETRIYQARWHSSESIDTLSVSEYLSEERIKKINPHQVIERCVDPEVFKAQRDNIVAILAIRPLLKKKVVQLSNGEMRKVMLSRALLRSPRLLILDNPFTGLDSRFRTRLKRLLRDLMQSAMRIIVVTSRQDEILPDITHLLVVENQKIIARGPKQKLLKATAVRKLWDLDSKMKFDAGLPQNLKLKQGRPAGNVLVHMKNVTISYGDTKVLQQINWTVKSGENWALLGPNGSGKTTLLSLILGDNPQAYANDITLFGRRKGSGESIWDLKKKMGFVSSELHMHYPRNISGFNVVCSGFFDSIGLYRRCSPQQRRTARSWMQCLGLSKFAETRFGKLSDGTQRMLLIARAMVKQPLLLILDEPCQGLDAVNRRQIVKLLDTIVTCLDTGIIYVTHDHFEFPSIITHVLKLDHGKAVGNTRVARIRANP
jgi:molybdate transport system ATP-binding protein